MTKNAFSKQVRQRAMELFATGIAHDPLVQKRGKVEKPIPIHEPGGDIASWFVGITVSDRIVGFIQLNTDLNLNRYSTFQRHASSLDGCPAARTWLEPTAIMEMAGKKASAEDVLSPPVLTYDRSPSRIAWAVKATDKGGRIKTIFVAGEFIYLSGQSNPGLTRLS